MVLYPTDPKTQAKIVKQVQGIQAKAESILKEAKEKMEESDRLMVT
jgi:hypothetical protein